MANENDGVTITMAVTLKPEVVEQFLPSVPEAIKQTASFPGFRSIRVVRHKFESNRLLMIESWDSEADFRAYMDWRVKSGSMDGLSKIVTASPLVDVWSVLLTQTKTS
jgi:quinol monooxygenase YgiN